MSLDSLLVSSDPQVAHILRPALEKLSINLTACHEVQAGSQVLSSEKFDAVIVDCDDMEGGLDLLQRLRRGKSNKSSVAFAILNGTTTKQAFELGANFVLQKPLSPLSTMRCFSAALGFMERERRRYFRHAVDMPVRLVFGQNEGVRATATNISEGGMALKFEGKLPNLALGKVVFTLPATTISLEPKAQIAWSDDSGRAGLRFLDVPQHSREQLDRWLTEKIKNSER